MALCHDERDYAFGFSRRRPRTISDRPIADPPVVEKPADRVGPASRRLSGPNFIEDTRDDIVRVLHERGPIHFEDFFWDMGKSKSVNSGWISREEVSDHLQRLKRMGVVRCDRDPQYPKYFFWSLILPHPLVFLTAASS